MYVELETPPPFMAKAILNFHFDFLTPSLSSDDSDLKIMGVIKVLWCSISINKHHSRCNESKYTHISTDWNEV